MAQKYWQTPEFLAAQKEAYAKLEASGFKDIEMLDPNGEPRRDMLKGMSQGDLARGLYKPESEEFYRLCRGHTHRIKDAQRRHVWHLFSEGYSVSRIHAALGDRYGLNRNTVDRWVRAEKKRLRKLVDEGKADE